MLIRYVAQSLYPTVHSRCDPSDSIPQHVHPGQFWLLRSHERHHSCLASEAGEAWRLRLHLYGERIL